jgi:hypothetical protein
MRNAYSLVSIVCAAAFAVAALPVLAKDDHAKGRPAHAGKGKFQNERSLDRSDLREDAEQNRVRKHARPNRAARISTADSAQVRRYYAAKPASWNPLPPGIAKNYARGKRLPPGIARQLPPELLATLPKQEGAEYMRVGRDVALVDTRTNVVVDRIKNVD